MIKNKNYLLKFTKRIFLSSLILIILSFFVPLTIEAIESGGIGGKPAYPRYDIPETESIFIHTLNPGAIQQEGVIVINNTSLRKTLSIYATDSTPSSGGGFACKQFSEKKINVGNWINIEQNEITLEPNTNVVVPFTINVPELVDVGEHNGCILIQELKNDTEDQQGMSLAFRSGMRVAITIPGKIIRKLELISFTSSKNKKETIILTPKVKNLGNTSVSPNIFINTHSILGRNILPQEEKIEGKYLVLRNDTSEWNFQIQPPLWGGWYRSELSIVYDNNHLKTSLIFFNWPTLKFLAIEIAIILILLLIIFFIFFIKNKKIKFQIINKKDF